MATSLVSIIISSDSLQEGTWKRRGAKGQSSHGYLRTTQRSGRTFYNANQVGIKLEVFFNEVSETRVKLRKEKKQASAAG
jgi:hypothetical protein